MSKSILSKLKATAHGGLIVKANKPLTPEGRKILNEDCSLLRSEKKAFIKSVGRCEICGKKNVRLECHHKYLNRTGGQYITDVTNGNCMCLCAHCHRIADAQLRAKQKKNPNDRFCLDRCIKK
jgi:hypothetical protein